MEGMGVTTPAAFIVPASKDRFLPPAHTTTRRLTPAPHPPTNAAPHVWCLQVREFFGAAFFQVMWACQAGLAQVFPALSTKVRGVRPSSRSCGPAKRVFPALSTKVGEGRVPVGPPQAVSPPC